MPGQVNTIRPCWRSSTIKYPMMLDLRMSLMTSMQWNELLWLIEIIICQVRVLWDWSFVSIPCRHVQLTFNDVANLGEMLLLCIYMLVSLPVCTSTYWHILSTCWYILVCICMFFLALDKMYDVQANSMQSAGCVHLDINVLKPSRLKFPADAWAPILPLPVVHRRSSPPDWLECVQDQPPSSALWKLGTTPGWSDCRWDCHEEENCEGKKCQDICWDS